jgi:hypothetical protein
VPSRLIRSDQIIGSSGGARGWRLRKKRRWAIGAFLETGYLWLMEVEKKAMTSLSGLIAGSLP